MHKMTRKDIEQLCKDAEVELLLADGLDGAFVGWLDGDPIIGPPPRAVYSKPLCVECLVEQGMDWDEAVEYLEYNTFQSYVGPQTPLFIN